MAELGSLSDLLDAIKSGAVGEVTAFLDNDNVSFYSEGSDEELLSLHPYEVQEQALAALGIKTQEV